MPHPLVAALVSTLFSFSHPCLFNLFFILTQATPPFFVSGVIVSNPSQPQTMAHADPEVKKAEKPAQSYAAAGGVVALINDKARKHAYGFLKMKMFFDKEKSQLVVQVLEARDLQGPKCSPYVKAYLMPDKKKDTKEKTSAKKNQLNPLWGGEELRWNMPKLNVRRGL